MAPTVEKAMNNARCVFMNPLTSSDVSSCASVKSSSNWVGKRSSPVGVDGNSDCLSTRETGKLLVAESSIRWKEWETGVAPAVMIP